MKRQLLLILFICIIIFTGCANKKYDEAIEIGKHALEESQYGDAVRYFEKAMDIKADDEEASNLLTQTELMTAGLQAFAKGELDEAKNVFDDVIATKHGYPSLKDGAENQINAVQALEDKYKEINKQHKDAQNLKEKTQYEDALSLIEEGLQEDFSHAYIHPLKDDLETLKEEIKKEKEKADAKAKKEAERKKAEEEKKVAEQKKQAEKEQQPINQLLGYWVTTDETAACHITTEYMSCAVAYSDVIFEETIVSTEENNEANAITITFGNGYAPTLHITNDGLLHFDTDTYKQVSKEKANSIYDGYYELP